MTCSSPNQSIQGWSEPIASPPGRLTGPAAVADGATPGPGRQAPRPRDACHAAGRLLALLRFIASTGAGRDDCTEPASRDRRSSADQLAERLIEIAWALDDVDIADTDTWERLAGPLANLINLLDRPTDTAPPTRASAADRPVILLRQYGRAHHRFASSHRSGTATHGTGQ